MTGTFTYRAIVCRSKDLGDILTLAHFPKIAILSSSSFPNPVMLPLLIIRFVVTIGLLRVRILAIVQDIVFLVLVVVRR